MAKGKKKAQQVGKDSNQGSQAGELEKKMGQLSVSGFGKSLFPAKPLRQPGLPHPGIPVILLSNLFKISVKQNKPIFRYAIEIDLIRDIASGDTERADQVPRRIRGDIARAVIEETMLSYVRGMRLPVTNGYNYCYDLLGKNLFTLFDLFQDCKDGNKKELTVSIKLPTITKEKRVEMLPQRYKVIIHKGTALNIPDLLDYCQGRGTKSSKELNEHLRLINTIIRARIMAIPENFCTATNTFNFDLQSRQISEGVQLNLGYYTSSKLTEGGLALNVHNVFGAFCEPVGLVDLLVKRFRVRLENLGRGISDDIREKLFKEVQKKQIEATHINYGRGNQPHYRKYRVEGIGGSSLDTFMWVDRATNTTKQITIADYFKMEYKFTLKYPKLPCVIDKGRKIPIEVCRLVEKQRVMRKMTPDETANVIRHAALPASETFKLIEKSVNEIVASSKPLRDFGLELDPKPVEVKGYELPPLSLAGNNGKSIQPRNGEYSTQNEKFVAPVTVNKWTLTFIGDEDERRDSEMVNEYRNGKLEADSFAKFFKIAGESKGATVRLCPGAKSMNEFQFLSVDRKESVFKDTLKRYVKYCNKSKTDHAIFVLPPSSPDYLYRYLQYLEATAQEGRKPGEKWTRISCIKYDNYKKKIINDRFNGSMFLSNLWLKYNTKLGGVNFVLNQDNRYPFLGPDYLFIAVDVCHPAPGDKLPQSVAAAVGMWDLTNPRLSYCTRLRVQKKTSANGSSIREDVVDIGNMVEDILRSYNARKKVNPKSIVILRDGVSEGQFQIVLEGELGMVKKSLLKMYGPKEQPKLSCLVVQKRHKVRFMRKVPIQTRRGPDHNMQPGTVVDSVVVHPNDFSFYLAPHKTIQGTTRPAHIYMILDEIKFSQDNAQAMIHALSYLSPRCSKSTSIPTPINLADRAAERGKNIVISWNDDNRMQMDEDARLERLNNLFDSLGDNNYLNTLFYI